MANSIDNINKYATLFIGFDEIGGNSYDNIGGYIGTLYNSPTRVAGWNGQGYAMSFNGTNQYVQFNNHMIKVGNKTIRFKIKTTDTLANLISVGRSKSGNTNYTNGFCVAMTDGRIRASSYVTSDSVTNNVVTNRSINDNQWHDIVVILKDGTVSIYVDGVFEVDGVFNEPPSYSNVAVGYLVIGRLNVSGYENYFNGQLDSIEFYDTDISIIPDKYLVFHNNEYKYHDGTSWQITTATEENFIQYGMNQLSQITESQWQELIGDISIVMWSDFEDKQYMNVVLERDPFTAKDIIGDEYDILVLNSEQANPQQLSLDAVSHPQTIYPTGDIQLFGVKELKSVNVTATGNGRIGISVDSGVTWNKLNGTTWDVITDIADGMTFADFNALTGEQLEALKVDSNTIRFAYYLSNDTEVDRIELRISMAGTPEFANKNDYDMSYDVNTQTITYNIKKSGNYIVNYINT